MKNLFQLFWHGNIAAFVAALGFTMAGGSSALAVNPVNNGTFDNPFIFGGATNWVVVYVDGCPGDFAVQSRITEARNGLNGFGASFSQFLDSSISFIFFNSFSDCFWSAFIEFLGIH